MAIRKPGMCAHDGCGIYGSLSTPGDKKRFCSEHAQGNMVNIHNKKCQTPGCMKQSVFGNKGEFASMCGTHRLVGMMNVKNKTCADPSCTKQPSYGFSGRVMKFCASHKLDGMINIRSQNSRRRSFPAGERCPLFGFPGGPTLRCSQHQKEGMTGRQARKLVKKRPATRGKPSAKPVVSPAAADEESEGGGKRIKRKRFVETPTPAPALALDDAENSCSSTAAGKCVEAKTILSKPPRTLKLKITFAAGDLVAAAGDSGAAVSSRVDADNDQSTERGSQNWGGQGALRALAARSGQMEATLIPGKASTKPMVSPRGAQEVEELDGYAPLSLRVAAVRRGSGGDGSPSPAAASRSGVTGRACDEANGGEGGGGASSSRTASNVVGKWRGGEGSLRNLAASLAAKYTQNNEANFRQD